MSDAGANTKVETTQRRESLLWRALQFVALLACLPTLGAFGARYWWMLDLLTHFRVYYAIALLAFCVMLLFRRCWKSLLVCLVALAFNAIEIVPLYLPPTQTASGPSAMRCLVSNVNSGNLNHAALLELVQKEQPDVVVVIEVNEVWQAALAPLLREYPHSGSRPQGGNFGIAFFSRLPVESIEFHEFGGSGLPSVVARVRVEDQTATLIGTHTVPPMTARWSNIRNAHLKGIAESVRDTRGPIAVMGDLNTTSWSPHFADMLQASGLRDSRRGFGIQPSWTGNVPLMAIPIDHVLVSPDIAVRNRRIGPDIGSDHLPVIIDLAVGDSTKN